jgi:hypothetical protein
MNSIIIYCSPTNNPIDAVKFTKLKLTSQDCSHAAKWSQSHQFQLSRYLKLSCPFTCKALKFELLHVLPSPLPFLINLLNLIKLDEVIVKLKQHL